MWIVQVALKRPYTFIVMALLILVISPLVILRTPTDIFPNIDIPVVSVLWQYNGLNAEEMENRVTRNYEQFVITVVNDVDHIESQTIEGQSIVKLFFRPTAKLDAAFAQTMSVAQPVLSKMPPGTVLPLAIAYNASSVPILQLALSGKGLSEQQLFDIAANFIRTQLATVQGAAIPWPYGGKQRQVMVDLRMPALQAKGLSPVDVVNAINSQNIILPGGTSKIGQFEYDVDLNGSPRTVAELNDIPIKATGDTTIYVRDVAHVRDGFSPQTNIVRRDGMRGALLTVQKVGDVSTLDIVKQVRAALPQIAAALPPALKIEPLADQSIFVSDAIASVIREAVVAACLTALMILLFLGSWRSTLIIAVSIPLSILTSICLLSALGQTINIMTLGGLALAVGILVDDATVTIENIERNFDMGKDLHTGILDGAAQIALPALVSTLCICIVFLPMFFLTGVARFLFIPLAESVVFAMLASYVLSRTLVPTMAMYLLKTRGIHGGGPATWNLAGRMQAAFARRFEAARNRYRELLAGSIRHRRVLIPSFLALCAASFLLVPWIGQDFFPVSDGGQFKLHLRAKTGTRIEETARICDLVEESLRRSLPPEEVASIIDNIGIPYSSINLSYSTSAPIGTMDADILVTLNKNHRPTADYVRELRRTLPRQFPGVAFYFLPADIISQILNFGLPAPIDIQIVGQDIEANRVFADRILPQLQKVPGAADFRIQQVFDQPKLHLYVDRTKAAESGFTERDVASSMLVSLSGSFQTQPSFWLDPKSGVSYNVSTQTPQYDMTSFKDLDNIPISGGSRSRPEILGDVASTERGAGMAVVSHYNVRRVIDIYGSAQDRDLGGVAADINRVVDRNRQLLPRGSQLVVRGQIETMRTSFQGLLEGLLLSIVLVYLLIVVNFQSWLDPFIIITALPAALAGIVVLLFASGTTLSVPALMGAIMGVGVATANSILVVSFAKEHLELHGDAFEAALEAGFTRFRPVLMTALAMILGMIPMALGLGEGGEQNAPLGRAVIGGLMFATVATLFFVPAVFTLLHHGRKEVHGE
ncbi:MAG TPA: efflux RND transporter permease subunit [Bryobacteraceae bacterium]|nr:efflux RND transporter permease subunit [Bryobacteraceae bacterium]